MTKKKESTEIATLGSTEVTVIPSKEELQIGMRKTLKELDDKLSKISGQTNKVCKTSGATFNLYEGYTGAWIPSNITDLNLLLKMLAQVRRIQKDQEELAKEFSLSKSVPCMIFGYNAKDWDEDLTWKINQVANAQTIKDINAAKTKLEAFLSEDDRLIKTLAEVEKVLNK